MAIGEETTVLAVVFHLTHLKELLMVYTHYAGNFDDNRFSSVGLGQGGGGAGITPIYLASWSHLMLAEMALTGGGDACFLFTKSYGNIYCESDELLDLRMRADYPTY